MDYEWKIATVQHQPDGSRIYTIEVPTDFRLPILSQAVGARRDKEADYPNYLNEARLLLVHYEETIADYTKRLQNLKDLYRGMFFDGLPFAEYHAANCMAAQEAKNLKTERDAAHQEVARWMDEVKELGGW